MLLFSAAPRAQISITAVGDIMLGSITPKKIIPPDSGSVFVKSIGAFLRGSDITAGNLEGSFEIDTLKPAKCSDSSIAAGKCYEFGMPSYLAGSLKQLGFNLISLNNNHSQDYGKAGYALTRRLLDSLDIKYMPKKGYAVLNIRGRSVAAAGFGFSGPDNNIFDMKEVKLQIEQLKKNYDIVLVYFHGGAEGKTAAHVKNQEETYLEDYRGNVIKFARTAVDAGADIVIGSGPHVLRSIEIYKKKLIVYSLGNFLTYGNVNITGISGITAILKVELNEKNGNFLGGTILPVIQRGRGIPYYDKNGRAIRIIRDLLSEDMILNNAVIKNDGSIKIGRIISPPVISEIKSASYDSEKYIVKKIPVPNIWR